MLYRMMNTVNQLCCNPDVDELVPAIHVMSYRDPRFFLQAVGPWLRAEEMAANTILPYAEMSPTASRSRPPTESPETHWIVCWSLSSPQQSSIGGQSRSPGGEISQPSLAPHLRLVLMAGESHMGPLPLYLFSPHPHLAHDDPLIIEAMKAIASRLVELRSPQRICSIFGPALLVQEFAMIWEAYSIHPRQPVPLQRTRMLSVQSAKRPMSPLAHMSRPGNFRVANESDIATIASLSQLTSPSLTHQQAHKHSVHLVSHSQAWVCEVQGDHENAKDNKPLVVSLCEVGRRSSTVAVITNLVTAVGHTRQGHGTRLLTHVVQFLFDSWITDVITYVPSDASASECIFRKIGFETIDDGEWVEWGL